MKSRRMKYGTRHLTADERDEDVLARNKARVAPTKPKRADRKNRKQVKR